MRRLFLLFLLAAACATAAPFCYLFNTGSAVPGMQDSHWTVSYGSVVNAPTYVTQGSDELRFPFPFWVPNNATSQWISVQPDYAGATDAPGVYTYSTTFDLTGYDPATASFSFFWAVDNHLTDVRMNGRSLGLTLPTPGNFAFQALGVPITSGFASGVNTLEFVTLSTAGQTGNPSGFRVEFNSFVADAHAPEPASFALLGLGLAGILLPRSRRFIAKLKR